MAVAAALVGLVTFGAQYMGTSKPGISPSPNGESSRVAERSDVAAPNTTLLAPTGDAAGKGRLRLVGSEESSLHEEALPWGLEEAPAARMRIRSEGMQAAGWR